MESLEDIKSAYITPSTAGISMRITERENQMYNLDIVKYNKVTSCGQNQY